ncbi:alpha/beta hydrolase [Streptacidiphilus rugosus]|uniref:alpha/beta hydrolase n=1 Tax=Streptacidiphilus rugosus TaxID=405783 RepID=UPI00055A1321|nr:alpha/beta hydrolase [Streptacidiphilus rugosus]
MPVVSGLRYGSGAKLLDVHVPEDEPKGTVLLWHGRGPQERDVLGALAEEASAQGLLVVVPDWRSDAEDGGWAHLRGSVEFVRQRVADWGGDAERAVLAGWSLGARTALATTLRPAAWDGWRPAAVVGIAGNYLTSSDPRMGPPACEDLLVTEEPPIPVQLVHGTADAVVDVRCSREFAAALEQHDWPVVYTETPTDHAGVVMAEYAPELKRCRPALAGHAHEGGMTTVRVLVDAAATIAAVAA